MTTANDITVEDLDNKSFVTNFVRGLVFPQFQLQEFFPEETFQGITYRWNKGTPYQEPAISYRAWDTEVPIGDRPGIERASAEMLPLGKKKILTEEHRLREEAIDSGDWGGFVQTSLQDLENLTQGVHSRWEIDRGALLGTGVINLKGPHTGTRYEWELDIDYGVPNGNKPTASPLWSSTSTADPILDLTNWIRAYKAANKGLSPGKILISQATLSHLLANAAMRALLYYGSPNTGPSVLTEAVVRAEFAAQGFPPFQVIDEQITKSDGTYGDVLPQDKLIMVLNPPGVSGDSSSWEGWSHGWERVEEVPRGVEGAGGADGR